MTTIEILRQYRISGYAIFDLFAAFLGMYLISPLLSKLFLKLKISIPKRNWLILTLPISILTHIMVGNMTQMTRDFLDINSHYILKTLIMVLIIFGLKNIKRSTKK